MNSQLDDLFYDGDGQEATEVDVRRTGWRPSIRRLALVALVLVATVAVGGAATLYFVGHRMSNNVDRIGGVFDSIDEKDRPARNPATAHSKTILAVGTDVRSTGQSTGRDATAAATVGDARTDAIMLIRLDTEKNSASIISIPRDSWVPIPGHDTHKINAAYTLGGPSLLVRTVEQLTKVRVDHFMIIDFEGFRSIVDVLGGVDVHVGTPTVGANGVQLHQGVNHLDGTQALAYVRERYDLPEGDFDRMRRQQNFLRSVFTRLAVTKPADDPLQAYQLLDSMTRAVTVDDGYDMDELRSLAMSAFKLKQDNVWFLTAPSLTTGWEGDESVVYLDPQAGDELWQAVDHDRMAEYVAAHQSAMLAATPR